MADKVLPKRNLAKAITWRFVGAIDTFIISWILTGNPLSGLKMGLADTVSKIFFYYLHERLWLKADLSNNKLLTNSRRRHLAKTITWRLFSSSLTVFLAWIILNDPWAGVQIGIFEIITKMFLYYVHERIWHKSNFGIIKDRRHE